jgi:hypothetical protein
MRPWSRLILTLGMSLSKFLFETAIFPSEKCLRLDLEDFVDNLLGF